MGVNFPKRQLNKDLLNVFLKPWQQVDKVRAFVGERDGIYRATDAIVAKELELCPTTIGNMKSRNSPIFTLYVLKWALKNNIDAMAFIKKQS